MEWASVAGGSASGPTGCIPSVEITVQGSTAVWKTSSSTASDTLLLEKVGVVGVR